MTTQTDTLKGQAMKGAIRQICNKLWKMYTLKQHKTAKQLPVSHSSTVLRKYRYGRKNKKTFIRQPILTTTEKLYTNYLSQYSDHSSSHQLNQYPEEIRSRGEGLLSCVLFPSHPWAQLASRLLELF